MKEFIDKLISRLEEKKSEHLHDEKVMQELGKKNMAKFCSGKAWSIDGVIQIVTELAEEYNHCTLCYLQSPCEYQNENVMLPNELLADENGWKSCSL